VVADSLGLDLPAIGAWTLGLVPVLYLALRGGGYDQVVYSEVGLAAWWIVLLGSAIGVLSLRRIGWLGWGAVSLLALFAVWTGVALAWTSSAERTVAELGRVTAYLGFLVLALCVLRRETTRPLLNGLTVAFGAVSLLAVLSRLYPSAFPSDPLAPFFPGSHSRLSYPFNYSNGTGNFLAIGIPLLLASATRARTLAGQAISAAALPVVVLGALMTASRGAVLTAVVGIAAFYLLAPDRLPKLASGLAAAAGSAVLVVSLLHRTGLRSGLSTPLAITQRHQLTVLLIITCCGVALLQVGIGLAARYAVRPRALRFSRRQAGIASVAALAVLLAVGVAARVPGKVSHQWQVFKGTTVTGVASGNVFSRLGTVSGSHRYQYWTAAVHAYESKPLIGIGPGTFQFYWARHAPFYEYIRNAHSLYLEVLAETGLIGFALIVGFFVLLLVGGVVRAMRAPPSDRLTIAAATAGLAAFCAAAAYDWMWQLAAAPVAALLLGAAIVACRRRPRARDRRRARWSQWPLRAGTVAVSLAALVAVTVPFAATSAIRSSQAAAAHGDLRLALSDVTTAQNVEPYAATPRLQRALILEQMGDLPAAGAAISQAVADQPLDSNLWLVRARIAAESGLVAASVQYYSRAHQLNPTSPTTAIYGRTRTHIIRRATRPAARR
jgi:hypothetical protein